MTIVKAINPKLIYCSISGYGQSGPRADEAGHDINYIGNTGLLDLQPGPIDAPVVPPALIADIAGGSFPAVINILLALARARPKRAGLLHRHRHDRRDVHLRLVRAGARQRGGKFPKPGEMSLVGGSPRYQLYPTKDGKIVACGAHRAEVLGCVLRGDWTCRRNSSTTRAIRKRRATRSRN